MAPQHNAQTEYMLAMRALRDSDPKMLQDRFPELPRQPNKEAWSTWEHDCMSERKRAAKQKENLSNYCAGETARQKGDVSCRHI